jgi:sterol desaturase/sphingolipid hydroxylase (fatty acid hydroxylase superfamily)
MKSKALSQHDASGSYRYSIPIYRYFGYVLLAVAVIFPFWWKIDPMRDDTTSDVSLALLPLIPPSLLLITLLDNPLPFLQHWWESNSSSSSSSNSGSINEHEQQHKYALGLSSLSLGAQLVVYIIVALIGYYTTHRLVPHIQQYTLRKGICGKDLGKRGTPLEDRDM